MPQPPQQEIDPVGARRDAPSDSTTAAATDAPADSAPPPIASGRGSAPPPSSTPWLDDANLPANPFGLPGLSIYSRHLINQLPGIYQTDFMARFLGIFESIQTPIEWTVDGFDLYLDPDSSPAAFLSWLAGWFGLTFDASWSEDQRRILIGEAHAIFARRGTRWALARILQIYTGCDPLITDTGDGIEPFNFRVRLALPDTTANRTLITRLIDAHKPAYTTYRLELIP
jgi:phage tail-like protein